MLNGLFTAVFMELSSKILLQILLRRTRFARRGCG
jgi:hypothetical protein